MSTLKTNNIEHLDATSPSIQVDAAGGIQVGGALTATTGTFSGNVSIAGELTYEDVTNIDSVGIVTARSGLHVTSGSLGIGTDNPSKALVIQHTVGRRHQFSYDDSILTIKGSNQNENPESIRLIGDSVRITTGTTGSGTERLRVTSDGDVGIGTITPYNASGYTTLTIDNNTTGSQIRMRTGGRDRALIYNTDTEFGIYAHNNIPINFYGDGRIQASLDYEGQLTLDSQSDTGYALWRKMSPLILAQYPDYSRPVVALSYQRTTGNLNSSGFFGDVIAFRGSTGAGHIPIFLRVCVSSAYTTNSRASQGLGASTFRFVTFDYDGNSYQGIQYNTDASANIMLDGYYATRGFKPFSLAASSVTSLTAVNATTDGRVSSTSSGTV